MDYAELYAVLPKSHWHWTLQDTQQWLDYIGLQSLQEKFCNLFLKKISLRSMAVFSPTSMRKILYASSKLHRKLC